jgi:phosphate starvation-inducible protein PhoH and related proteins
VNQPVVQARFDLHSNDTARAVSGPKNIHLRAVESRFGVTIRLDGKTVIVEGDKAEEAMEILQGMEHDSKVGRPVDPIGTPMPRSKGSVTPRTQGQQAWRDVLTTHTLGIADGPAGTGKTQISVDVGVEWLKAGKVERLVLSRPAVEAGERLGFLPGDMKDKVDPYMQPLYDALGRHYTAKALQNLLLDKTIEIAPIAFLRGRTLGNAAVILDEAQNLTVSQMKMALTRLGEGSTMAIVGDLEQIDLPRGTPSGLAEAMRVLQGVQGIGIVQLTRADCVRSPLVGRILDAYAQHAQG